MDAIAYQITSLMIVYSAVYSDANQRKHQSSASLALWGEFTGTGEFPAQMVSNAGKVSIWWRHHDPVMGEYNDGNNQPLILRKWSLWLRLFAIHVMQ